MAREALPTRVGDVAALYVTHLLVDDPYPLEAVLQGGEGDDEERRAA